jgi:hypothetical protein
MHPQKSGRVVLAAAFFLTFLSLPIQAQMRHTAAASDPYHHVFAIVPLIGKGTGDDPQRPMFVPAQGFRPVLPPSDEAVASGAVKRSGIIGYHAQISDDGKSALVEFVGVSVADFKDILATTDSRVQLFQKGIQSKTEIEAAFKVQRKDFSIDHFIFLGAR